MEQIEKMVREAIEKLQEGKLDETFLKELLSKQSIDKNTTLEEIIKSLGEKL